jgi:hypothetical protein
MAVEATVQKRRWRPRRQLGSRKQHGGRAEAAMAAWQWRWQSKMGVGSTVAAKEPQGDGGSAAASGQY